MRSAKQGCSTETTAFLGENVASGKTTVDRKRLEGNVYKIVLTGGPCAGKSTALAKITSALTNIGIRVFTVPEAATLLFTNGVKFETPLSFQLAVLRVQTALEDNISRLASVSKAPAVVLCDRGLMDGSAYVDEGIWSKILETDNLTEAEIRDARYHTVIHMVTAADGAEEYYTLANNASRHESVDEAKRQDDRTQQAWIGHSRLQVIGNRGEGNSKLSFQRKIGKVIDAVKASLGLVCLSPKYERRFLVQKKIDRSEIPSAHFTTQNVHKYFFASKRDGFLYSYVQKKSSASTAASFSVVSLFRTAVGIVEERDVVSRREFGTILQTRRVEGELKSSRLSFMFDKYYFQFESYDDLGTTILRIQPPTSKTEDELPDFPFLDAGDIKDVTDDAKYAQYELAKRGSRVANGVTRRKGQ
eukprot:g4259.t1